MSQPAKLKAVIFDLDGVLVSTSEFHAQAWASLVRSIGYEPPADLEERVKGISRLASLKIALGDNAKNYTEEELVELAGKKNEHYLRLVKDISPDNLFPGVLDLFHDLQQAGIKIVLGSASKNARPVLDGMKITQYFDAIADGFEYKHGKPHPDVFITGAAMVGATPEECIVVEDAAAGISAALDGGFVAVAMGNYESLKHAHLYINSLEDVSAESLRKLHARFASNRWLVVREGVDDAKREESNNTILTIGNGRYGIRGYLPELNMSKGPGVFAAGLYDELQRYDQHPDKWPPFLQYWGNPDLAINPQIEACIINCPDLLDMHWTIKTQDGKSDTIDFTTGELKSLRRTLNMRNGMFTAEAHWISPGGLELNLTQRRFADAVNTDTVRVQYELEPLNFAGSVTLRGGINTTTQNVTEIPQRLYETVDKQKLADNLAGVVIKGKSRGATAALAAGITIPDRPHAECDVELADDGAYVTTTVDAEQDKILYIQRVGAIVTGRQADDPLAAAADSARAALGVAFYDARIDSTAFKKELWESSDIIIEGDLNDQLAARFSVYQLLIAAPTEDLGVSIPAKALTGEGYRGMVFWDTDIYMTPFYNFTQPQMARNLAIFRCNGLEGARAKAERYGFRGASYPWETGVSGYEETEKWLRLITHQSHITADVAYALQQYADCTQDSEFYTNEAAEVLIDTARFWLSKCVPSLTGDDGKISIPDAGGPDEYHVVSNDSAFVNNMAIFNLKLAEEAIAHLKKNAPAKLEEIKKSTGLTDSEISQISEYQQRIHTMQQENGLIEECRGFFDLKDERANEAGAPYETQTVKQADVLLLFYLLSDKWPLETLRTNYEYYEPRTIHASSLSQGVHGLLAAELGLDEKAEIYMRKSLGMDLFDEMGNAVLGAHMAAHGMNWIALTRGFGGVRPSNGRLLVEPRLPKKWSKLAFSIKWHGADASIGIKPDGTTVRNSPDAQAALPLLAGGKELELAPGEEVKI